MVEVSAVLLTLLIEAVVLLLLILGVGIFFILKRKRKDRQAVQQLVDQIKHQSDARKIQMGAHLTDKFQFEEDELINAVELIDKTEKKFFQKLIHIYLKRDAEGFTAIDANLAEVVEVYKSFKPVQVETVVTEEVESASMDEIQQLEQQNKHLQRQNDHLRDELQITKSTMNNMIAEFGNMFGGGSGNNLDHEEVVSKVVNKGYEAAFFDETAEGADDDQVEELSEQELEAFMADTVGADDVTGEESNTETASSAADLVAELDEELGLKADDLADVSVEDNESELLDDLVADSVEDASSGDQQLDVDDITGIDIGSDEDIDKLLQDMDISREKLK